MADNGFSFEDFMQSSKPKAKAIRVTASNVVKIKQERQEDMRKSFEDELSKVTLEAEGNKLVVEEFARENLLLKESLEEIRGVVSARDERILALEKELAEVKAELVAERSAPKIDETQVQLNAELRSSLEKKDSELAALRVLLEEAQRTSLSSGVLLDRPAGFGEKFPGEMREHVLEALRDACDNAANAGRERRERILEAVLYANPISGTLDEYRDAVRGIFKDAGSEIDESTISALTKLGFKYVSGKNHHKIDWAGVRFPVSKTPSDYRSSVNTAIGLCNKVF